MLIDASIRDVVLLPLCLFVAATHFLRSSLFKLLAAPAGVQSNVAATKAVAARSARFRAYAGYITGNGAAMRKEYLAAPNTGALRADVKDPPMNPFAQMDVMKLQLVNQALYLGLFYAIQNALAGFVVVKVPFGLTERFKQVTQQGIGVAALDTSLVSSGSWYMIAQSGFARVMQLFTSNAGFDDVAIMQMQMGGGAPGADPNAFMAKQVYTAELSAMDVLSYRSVLCDSEREVLALARSM